MMRSSESRLEGLEAQYSELLISALHRCAMGKWGLFGQNDKAVARDGLSPRCDPSVAELLELGATITELRRHLGYVEGFAPHVRLLQMRSSHDANTLGEPKVARQWLDELRSPER